MVWVKLIIKNLKNKLLKYGIIPVYTEDALFLMSLAFIILFSSDKLMRHEILNFIFDGFRPLIFGLLGLGGIIFYIYCGFSLKKKIDSHKFFMLSFAVFINSGAGISAGTYLLKHTRGFWLIFPILNIFNAFLLLFLLRIGEVDEHSISDDQAKYWEIALGSIIVLIIIFISHHLYKNYWAITFSITV